MRLKSFIISLLAVITLIMSILLNKVLRTYRIYTFINNDSTPQEIERIHTIMRYQNIIWMLIVALLLGLIVLVCLEHKKKLLKFIKKF